MRTVAILGVLGAAAPVWAQTTSDTARDTATEKKADADKAATDTKDTAKAKSAKAKKKSHKAAASTKKHAKETKDKAESDTGTAR